MGHVVVDADGESIDGIFCFQILIDCCDLGRISIFGAQSVAAADDLDVILSCPAHHCADILIKRLAQIAHAFAAVEDRDALAAVREHLQQMALGERSVQMHLNEADLLALRAKRVDGLLDRACNGSHSNDDVRRFRIAVVVEQSVVSASDGVDLYEVLLNDLRQIRVILVVGLTNLEVYVRVLYRISQGRVLRIQSSVLMGLDVLLIHQGDDFVHVRDLDLVDLMRCSESVEEVHERNVRFHCRQVSYRRQVDDLLHASCAVLGPSCISACHDVGVIAEDTHGVGSYCSRCHMQYCRLPFARDPVQDRDHQHQSLG